MIRRSTRASGGLALHGRIRWRQHDAAGQCVADSGWRANTLCNPTAYGLVQWLTGTGNIGYAPVPYPHYAMLGTGSGTTSATDTALFTPVSSTQVPAQLMGPSGSNAATATWTFVWGASYGPLNATEIGMFDQNGTLWSHIAGLTLNLNTTTTTTVLWEWTITLN